MSRPHGSNADEWHLFLSEHLDNRAGNNGLTYMAVQIAEVIDEAMASHDVLIVAAKDLLDTVPTPPTENGRRVFEGLRDAIWNATP
jgi:hypothetical protein